MGKPAQELLKAKKYDVLISMLTDRFGTDGTATIWLDAEHRLEGFLKTTAKLSSGEQLHAEGTTLVVVTHDAEVGASAERVITLEYGKVTSEHGGTEFGKAARKDVI